MARITLVMKARGMALVDGQRRPTIRIKATRMGTTASKAKIPTDINLSHK